MDTVWLILQCVSILGLAFAIALVRAIGPADSLDSGTFEGAS